MKHSGIFYKIYLILKPVARAAFPAFMLCAGLLNQGFAQSGESGWMVLRKVQSSQIRGIASSVPCGYDIAGFLYNPAVSALTSSRQMSFISELGANEDKFGGILYSHPLAKCVVSGGFAYYDAGVAELNWIENGVVQTRTARSQADAMGIISVAFPLSNILFSGISIKAARSTIAETKTAYAFAGDAGVFLTPNNNFSLSAALQNAGSATKFINEADPLPLSGYIGSAYTLRARNTYLLNTAGVTYNIKDNKSIPEMGIELGNDIISLQAGYRFAQGDLKLQIGFHITAGSVNLGYAYIPAQYLNPMHRITISYKFAKTNEAPRLRRK